MPTAYITPCIRAYSAQDEPLGLTASVSAVASLPASEENCRPPTSVCMCAGEHALFLAASSAARSVFQWRCRLEFVQKRHISAEPGVGRLNKYSAWRKRLGAFFCPSSNFHSTF